MGEYAAFRSGREAPARIATSVVMFAEADELLPEEPMYQPVIPFYPAISSGAGSSASDDQSWTSHPSRVDLTFYQGDDVTITLLVQDPNDTTPDMSTAWDWTAQIRTQHTYRSTLVNTFSVQDVYVPPVVGPPAIVGYTQVTMFLPRSENVYCGSFHWDLFSKSPFVYTGFPRPPDVDADEPWPPTDQIRTWLYGEVTILPRVTSTDSLPVPDAMAPGWSGPTGVTAVNYYGGFAVGPNGRVP